MGSKTCGWILIGFAISTSAFSQESESTKSYVLLSAGRSNTPIACDSNERWLVNSTCNSKGTIYRIGYGFNLNSLLGIEISYGDFAHAREDGVDPTPPPSVPSVGPTPYYRTWSATGWEIAAVGTVHLGEHLSLHGKAGWLRANVEEEVWYQTYLGVPYHSNYKVAGNTASVSGGLQIDFNRDVGLRFQVNRYNKLPGTHQLQATTNKYKATSLLASLVLKF